MGSKYYSNHEKPFIDFQPVLITNNFNINWEFEVNHYYSKFDNNWNVNFVDSVLMHSYYSDGDSILLNNSYLVTNIPNSINYIISYSLDSTLMKNNFSFYYKIYAVDKGIVPEYAITPDTGYYKLVYDPNTISEEIFNPIFTYSLSQNYPNPFNPSTSIQYAVGSRQFVTLKVYDVLGSEVTTLVNEEKQPGVYEVEF